jgi:hypothetical protein
MDTDLRSRLNQLHGGLLDLHKKLLDHERARYENVHGRIPSAGHFLQLIINDPWFAWLRPMSGMVAQVDEFVETKKPTEPALGEAFFQTAREMVRPDENGTAFQKNYAQAIQDSAEIGVAHSVWMDLINRIGGEGK